MVIAIVGLVSAVALPTVLPALNNRQVSEAARILQAALAGARDAAIRANAPRGIRLLPDATLSGLVQNTAANGAITGGTTANPYLFSGQVLTASRIVPIEPAPDLVDSSTGGSATFVDKSAFSWTTKNGSNPPPFPFPLSNPSGTYPFPVLVPAAGGGTIPFFNVLIVAQAVYVGNTAGGLLPNPPTNWFWNVRIGDKFRSHDSGRYYTVVGPMTVPNPEGFVNDGLPEVSPYGTTVATRPSLSVIYGPVTPPAPPGSRNTVFPEFLFLVNGVDEAGINPVTGASSPVDGYVDDGVDGIDNNLNGLVDDISEWVETETWLGAQAATEASAQFGTPLLAGVPQFYPPTFKWTIVRRPVPSAGAREVSLPGGAVVDLTTWDLPNNERSRLPVDQYSGNVDILLNQAGQVVPTTVYSSPSSYTMAGAFLHFWIADRTDVYAPNPAYSATTTVYPLLPIPPAPGGVTYTGVTQSLKRDRQLLTLYSRTGHVVTNAVENFDFTNAYTTHYDVSRPFDDAQLGIREAK